MICKKCGKQFNPEKYKTLTSMLYDRYDYYGEDALTSSQKSFLNEEICKECYLSQLPNEIKSK